jgi:BASS family bile acid:Na+ symporter
MVELLRDVVGTLARLAVPLLMFSLGLGATRPDFGYFLRRPGLFARSLLAVLVLVPAFLIVADTLLPLPLRVKAGLGVLAIAPGAPFIPRKAQKFGGNPVYAAHLFVTLGLLSLVSVPLSLLVLSRVFGHTWALEVGAITKTVFIGQVFPLLVGLALRHFAAGTVDKFEKTVRTIANVAFAALLLVTVVLVATKGRELFSWSGLAAVGLLALLAFIALGIGHVLGGPHHDTRCALALAGAMRNPALALLIAQVNFPTLNVLPTVMGYLIACALAAKIYRRATEREGGEAPLDYRRGERSDSPDPA